MASIELELLPSWGLFALVVKHQSFSEAARQTGLTRSAVSQRIAKLEGHVGAELLRRTTRRVVPTSRGLALLDAASRLLDDAAALDSLGPSATTPLRVNAPAGLLTSCLGHSLRQFVSRNPGPIDLHCENRPIDLFETKDDVVVRVARQLPQGVVGRKLGEDVTLCVASPAWLEKHGAPLTPQGLLQKACLHYRPTPLELEWRFTPARGEPFSVPISPRWTVDDGEVMHDLVLNGQGLAVLPRFLIRADLEQGRLVPVLTAWELTSLEIWALLPGGRKSSPRARALVEHLAKNVTWPPLPARTGRASS